jgi:hypothetical protein
MSREDATSKARRYVSEARLTIVAVDGDSIDATCKGDGRLYQVTHRRGQGWHCDCDARGRCSHQLAAGLVTVVRSSSVNR